MSNEIDGKDDSKDVNKTSENSLLRSTEGGSQRQQLHLQNTLLPSDSSDSSASSFVVVLSSRIVAMIEQLIDLRLL